jgi:hypothetical protein
VPSKLVVTVALLAHLPPPDLLATRLPYLHTSPCSWVMTTSSTCVRDEYSRADVPAAWMRRCRHGQTVRETLERAHLFQRCCRRKHFTEDAVLAGNVMNPSIFALYICTYLPVGLGCGPNGHWSYRSEMKQYAGTCQSVTMMPCFMQRVDEEENILFCNQDCLQT